MVSAKLPIIRRKLAVPAGWQGAIPRPRLLSALDAAIREGRHVCVVAGSGYGKTSLLSAFCEGRTAAWVGLDAEEAEPTAFMAYLIAALERTLPGFGTEAQALLGGGTQAEGVAAALTTLLADLDEQCDAPAVLVLDDFHRAESPATCRILAKIIQYLPPDLRIVVAARVPPAVELAALEARREVRVFRDVDLAFDPAELEVLRPGVAPAEREALLRSTGGWPAAMGLDAAQREAFLDEQLLGGQPADVRAFLLRAALIDAFDPAACESALGVPLAGDMRDRLLRFQLVRTADEGRLEVPEPLRGLLRRRFGIEVAATERAFILGRLASHMWGEGQALSALSLWAEAGLADVAADHVALVADEWLAGGRLEALASALAALGAAGAAGERPDLLAVAGEVQRRQGNLDRAEALLEQALQAFEARGDANGTATVRLRQAQVLASRGQADKARSLAAAAEAASGGDERLRADALNLEGGLALFQGLPQDAAKSFEASLRLARRLGDRYAEARAAHNLGVCYTRLGELRQALEAYDAALAGASETPVVWMTPINRALVLCFLGRTVEGREAAEAALALVRRFKLAREEGYALRTLGHACAQEGDVTRAIGCFEAAIALSRHMGDSVGLAVSLNYRADLAALEGDIDAALAHSGEAAALVGAGGVQFNSPEFDFVRAKILLAADRCAEAAEIVEPALQEAHRLGYRYWSFLLSDLAARIARRQDRGEEASRLEEAARSVARSQGYVGGVGLAGDDGVAGVPGGGGDGPRVAASSIQQKETQPEPPIRYAASVPAPDPERVQTVEPARERCADLAVRCFGGMRVLREGQEVGERQWQTAKAKLLLAYLLHQPDGATKDALMEAVFGVEPVTNATFNMTLVRLRKALEPDLEARAASKFVLRGEGRYSFNWQTRVELDTRDFEAALKSPRGAVGEAKLRAALDAYTGPFLPEFEADWVVALRQRYREKALDACRKLLERAGERSDTLELLFRGLEIDPLSEEFNRELILQYVESGEPHLAREHFALCSRRYRDMGLEPPEDLADLVLAE